MKHATNIVSLLLIAKEDIRKQLEKWPEAKRIEIGYLFIGAFRIMFKAAFREMEI